MHLSSAVPTPGRLGRDQVWELILLTFYFNIKHLMMNVNSPMAAIQLAVESSRASVVLVRRHGSCWQSRQNSQDPLVHYVEVAFQLSLMGAAMKGTIQTFKRKQSQLP